MAVVFDPNKDKLQQPGGAPQAPASGGQAGTIQGGAGAAAPQAPKQGTGYVNLGKYLGANQGRGEQMAGTIGNQYKTEADGLKQGLDNYSQDFHKQVKENVFQADQGQLSNIVGTRQKYGMFYDKNPGSVSLGEIGDLEARTNRGYAGPQGFGAEDKQAQFTKLGERLDGTKDVGSQTALLDSGNGRYSGGQRRLDTAIMKGDTGAQNSFQNLRSSLGWTGGYYNQAASAGNAAAHDASRTSAQAQAQVRDAARTGYQALDANNQGIYGKASDANIAKMQTLARLSGDTGYQYKHKQNDLGLGSDFKVNLPEWDYVKGAYNV